MKVKVVSGNRGKFVLRWKDQHNKTHQRTTELDSRPANRKKAYKLAADLESELAGDSPPCLMIPKRKREEDHRVNSQVENPIDGDWHSYKAHFKSTNGNGSDYIAKVLQIAKVFELQFSPATIKDVTASRCRQFLAACRSSGLAETTIKTYWNHFKAFLGPASDDGLVEIPRVRLPKASKKSKGRPVTGEEFDRMVKAAVDSDYPDSWKFDLRGLWFSGLRISEAYRITWSRGAFHIDIESECFVIEGDQKNKRHQRLPMSPEFVDLLAEVPSHKRNGRVFSFHGVRGNKVSLDETERVISSFGETAGIRTDESHTASAHDLRRSFGLRWATRVHAPVLQKLMRHASITTTMEFYAHLEVDDIKAALKSALEKHVGDQKGDQSAIRNDGQ